MFPSCPVGSLLHGIGGEDPEDEGNIVGKIEFRNAVGHSLAYIIEMGGFALHHTSKANYRIDLSGLGQHVSPVGKFKTAGHPMHLDVAFFSSEFQ